MSEQDGGAVFPCGDFTQLASDRGMTLRDYFAAKALSNLADNGQSAEFTAQRAYEYADAMLKARAK